MDHKTTYKRKWLVLTAVATGVFLATIDGSIVNIALPTLVKALHADFAVIQWIVLAYLLTVTTLLLSFGRLGDMIGKKPLYMTGQVVFTISSALCGIAPNVYWLILFRVLQACGAAMIMALSSALITEAFPPEERGKALGINGTMVSIGVIAGPTVGGLILNSFSWHWIFLVNLPVGIIGVLLVQKYVPVKAPPGGQKFDYRGSITLFFSLLSLLLGMTLGQQIGFGDYRAILLILLGAILLILFVRFEKQSDHPMIDISLFKNKLFSINLITGFMAFICSSGMLFLMPFFLQDVQGYDPSKAGMMMAVVPMMIGVVAPIAGSLSDRFGTRPLATIGLALLMTGYILVSTLSMNTSAVGYLLRFLPIGIGSGIFQSPNNSAIMGSVPPSRLGVASGLLSITRTMGQTTGIAVLGAIWAWFVSMQAGEKAGNVNGAPLVDQVIGLQRTMQITAFIIGAAFLLSLYALFQWIKINKAEKVNSAL